MQANYRKEGAMSEKLDLQEGAMSEKLDLDAMTVDELWHLHQEIARILVVRVTSQKRELEMRLAQLSRETQVQSSDSSKSLAHAARRKYPPVFPKFRNPQVPAETWSGRGKQPRWLSAALNTEEFVITDGVGFSTRG
jgi:DNA-binding protein H-NS